MADSLPIITQTQTGIKPGITPVVTSEAPKSQISGAEVAQPDQELAQALGKTGDALSDVAVPLAKSAADQAVLAQKVTRGPDGSVGVEDPISAPLLFGAAGDAYHRVAAAGTIAEWSNAVSEGLNDIHQKHPNDPGAFETASSSFLAGIDTGNPEVQEAVQREGAQLQTQHANKIADEASQLDIENKKQSIIANLKDQTNTLTGLSHQPGGTYTPEFQQALGKMNAYYDALATNPLFKTPQDQIDLEKKQTLAMLQGEALVTHVDDSFTKRGKAAAQQELDQGILQNTNLREVDRTRLYTQGMSRLAYLSNDARANVDANRLTVGEMEKGLAARTLTAEDPAVGMAIRHSTDIGDTEGAQRLTAAAAVQQHFRAINPLPDSVRTEALGVHLGPVERVQGAILGQESGNRDNAATSVTGAMGPGQVEPATFAQYARPGESIDNPTDNRNVSNRIVADYYQKYGGDSQRVAVAYFSGPGNVAPPGSPTPWITDKKDPTGKSTSSYVSDVAGRLGAPSASGPGFTADDVAKNPFLLSAYTRSLAADPELRVRSAKETAAAANKTLDNGLAPAPNAVAEVIQAGKLDPDKMGSVADALTGRLAGKMIDALPADQRQPLIDAYTAAASGPDVHQMNIANAALSQHQRQLQNMKDHPFDEAHSRGWTPEPMPIDPTHPETLGPALEQRGQLSARIGALNHMPAPSALDKDDIPKIKALLANPDPAAKAGIYGEIAKLPPDVRRATLIALGGNEPEGMAEAAAGSMMATAPDIAASIFRGQTAMKADPRYSPEGDGAAKDKYYGDLDKALPASIFTLQERTDPAGAYATVVNMVKARYADLSAQAGQTAYSPDRLQQAVTDVTGGTLTLHGGKFIAPARGMTQRQFDGVLGGVTDNDLAGVKTLGGQSVTAQYLRSSAQLESVGDGRYFVKLGRDPMKPVYAYQADRKFVLNLRGRTPMPPPPPPYTGVLGEPVARQ